MRLSDVGGFPKSYAEAEAMGLIRGGEFAKCPVCGCERIERRGVEYDECHGVCLARYEAVCGGCGEELGEWDHGAPFPAYL